MNSQQCESQNQSLIKLYTRLANRPGEDFGWGKGKSNAITLGYKNDWLQQLNDCVWESAAAVGSPFLISPLMPGESVLDLGCGAGADACIAGLLVGKEGSVLGLDCTPAMVEKARNNVKQSRLDNVSIKTADIAKLPIEDNSIDVVISNGAINLSHNKAQVFDEAYRVLKSGGRLQIADMIREGCESTAAPAGEACSEDESWANCVQGTLSLDELLTVISESGFTDVHKVAETGYKTAQSTMGVLVSAFKA